MRLGRELVGEGVEERLPPREPGLGEQGVGDVDRAGCPVRLDARQQAADLVAQSRAGLRRHHPGDRTAGLVARVGDGDGIRVALFDAAHGTAPDITGKNLANPTAIFLALVLLLYQIGEIRVATAVKGATLDLLRQGIRTRDLGGVESVGEGELTSARVGSVELVAARVDGSLLAFRDACAACGEPLAGGELSEGTLACPACARRFYLPRAGRSLDDDRLLLEPVPLLEGVGGARVALPA